MTSVGICTAVWNRLELTEVWWKFVARLRRQLWDANIRSTVFVAGSQHEHAKMAYATGFASWHHVENRGLGEKFNTVVAAACYEHFDYVLILGSDDFMCPTMIEYYVDAITAQVLYVGAVGLYFYEPATESCVYFPGYHKESPAYGHSIGAGRLIHRSVLKPVGYRPWPDHQRRGLDGKMFKKLRLPLHQHLPVAPDAVLLDVKTNQNIWPYRKLERLHVLEPVNAREVLSVLPEWETIRDLKQTVLALPMVEHDG